MSVRITSLLQAWEDLPRVLRSVSEHIRRCLDAAFQQGGDGQHISGRGKERSLTLAWHHPITSGRTLTSDGVRPCRVGDKSKLIPLMGDVKVPTT